MKHIRDLHFQKEILPLFDSVSNEFSRDVLIGLLSTFPASLEEVYLRQDILKGFLRQPMMTVPFCFFIYTHLHQLREAIAPAGEKIGQLIFEQEGLNRLLSGPRWPTR